MNCLAVKPVSWMALREEDHATLYLHDVLPQFHNSASAQLAYVPAGTIHCADRLAQALIGAGIDESWSPTEISPIIKALIEIGRFPYQLAQDSDAWSVELSTPFKQEPMFEDGDWRILFEDGARYNNIRVPSKNMAAALNALHLLNGTHSTEEIAQYEEIGSAGKCFIKWLVENNLVLPSERVTLDCSRVPEFVFLGHSGLAVRDGNDILVIDPIATPVNLRLRRADRNLFALLNSAKAIFVSHHHWDHLHYQTLARVRRDQWFLVPKVEEATYFNPSLKTYLGDLGFENVTELGPWEEIKVGGIVLRSADFFGESFGLSSRFNGLTYFLQFSGLSLYGSVDACHDELGGMDETIGRVAEWGGVDIFCFGSSAQRHERPWMAGAPYRFSNALRYRQDLIRYHPDVDDVERWTHRLRPRWLVPYAEFLFGGCYQSDVQLSKIKGRASVGLEEMAEHLRLSKKAEWLAAVIELSKRTETPLMVLQPMQGAWSA